jgi:hypothetical protein
MFLRLFSPVVFYESNPTGAPASVAPPGADPTAQPPSTPQPQQGQGQQQQGQGDGFRSTFFPNVPDEQWALIEPHISNVNRHVTQLQQRYAPFSSYTPEAVQGLARFADAFDKDPAGQWIVLARALQQQGKLDPDLDIDHLETLLSGEQQQQAEVPQGFNPEDPRDALIMQLQQKLQEVDGWRNEFTTKQQHQVEDQALKRSLGWMREQLKAGGIDESLLTQQRLIAAFVGHGGNAQAAVQDQLEYRTAILGGVVPDPQQQKSAKNLKLPNGAPKLPAERRPRSGANRRGMFAGVTDAAEQYISRANQSS